MGKQPTRIASALGVAAVAYLAGGAVLSVRRVLAGPLGLDPVPTTSIVAVAAITWLLVFVLINTRRPSGSVATTIAVIIGQVLLGGAAIPLVLVLAMLAAPNGLGAWQQLVTPGTALLVAAAFGVLILRWCSQRDANNARAVG